VSGASSRLLDVCVVGSPVDVVCEGMIPRVWQRYTIPAGTTVINWIIDFNERVKQLHTISQASQQGGAAALKVLVDFSQSNLYFVIPC